VSVPKISIPSLEALKDYVGQPLGPSEWTTIDQDRIAGFADVTGDHQWIHVDVERASRESPWKATIAHGYLTQSLVNLFMPQIVQVRGIAMGINYGADRLRFPAPVPVGSRIRGRAEIISAEDTKDGAVQAKVRITVEIENSERPACVVDAISRYYPA